MNAKSQVQEVDRIRLHTQPEVLERIDQDLENSVRFHATQPERVVTARIQALEEEWDVERWLETNGAAAALGGAVLGLFGGKKWLLVTCGALMCVLEHAVTGWSPLLPLLRRRGVRTRSEIDREKFALKVLRGDFKNLPQVTRRAQDAPIQDVLQTVNA